MSHVQNRVNHFWVILLKKGLKIRKKSNPLSYIRKKRFNSLGHVKQKLQSIESIFEILGSYFPRTINSFFESYILHKRRKSLSHSKNESFSLTHVEKKGSISMSHTVQKGFNSVSRVWKGFKSVKNVKNTKKQFLESFCEECSILWVVFKKVFGSLSHIRKNSSLWVIFCQRKSSLLWVSWRKKFNSVRHIQKNSVNHIREEMRCSILWVIFEKRDVQFCASYSRKEMFNSVSVILKNFNSLSHFLKIHSWTHFL